MKFKTLFIGIGFVVLVFMAGSLTSQNKSPQVWKFINKFNDVSNKVVTEFENPNEPDEKKRIDNGIDKAQAILEQVNNEDGLPVKDSLKKDLANLKSSGNIQITETTQQALDNCLANNVQRILDIYKKRSDLLSANIEKYESVKAEYEEENTQQKWNEMQEIVKQLKADRQALGKLKKFFGNFKSILN